MAPPQPDKPSARPDGDQEEPGAASSAPSASDPSRDAGVVDEDIYGEDLGDYLEDEDQGEPVEWFDEQGRRHVRRAAPEGTEEILEQEIARETALPDRVERWRQRSATGAVVTAFALGLQAALDTQREEPAIIMETSGEPPTDLPVEARLEQLGPRQSTVKVRTWLFNEESDAEGAMSSPGTVAPAEAGGATEAPGAPPAPGPDRAEGEAREQ